ncbi:armadillo-type protein [Mycena capillaripes]|nr:armadillo-type protein [Mycena capillaripes]
MQPLARQQNRTSLHSWWSDSNPGLHGPTINIHTMAKPLIRFLYHRQAVQFIRRNAGIHLTPTVLEIFSTYLLCKYVSFETQWTVLAELENRAQKENEAAMIVESPVLAKVLQLLESSSPVVRQFTCRLVQNLAHHEATASTILKINPCAQLVSLLHDEHPNIVKHALKALTNAASWSDSAQAVIHVRVQDHVFKLLESSDEVVRKWTCWLVGNLAWHEATAATILKINPCVHLVFLLGDEHSNVVEEAIKALANSAWWQDGAEAVSTCRLVRNLAYHEATATIILEINPCPALASLLQDTDITVCQAATGALARISNWPDGIVVMAGLGISEALRELKEIANTEDIHAIQDYLAWYKRETATRNRTDRERTLPPQVQSRLTLAW